MSATRPTPTAGSTHIIVPAPPKWPNVAGVLRPGPVRLLVAADLDAQSPRARIESPHAGNDTGEVRVLRVGGGAGVGARSARPLQLGEKRRGRRPCSHRAPVTRRAWSTSSPAVSAPPRRGSRRTACPGGGDGVGRHLDAGVGVDPPAFRRRDRVRRRRTGSRRRGPAGGAACSPAGRPGWSSDRSLPRRRPASPSREHLGDRGEPERRGRCRRPCRARSRRRRPRRPRRAARARRRRGRAPHTRPSAHDRSGSQRGGHQAGGPRSARRAGTRGRGSGGR